MIEEKRDRYFAYSICIFLDDDDDEAGLLTLSLERCEPDMPS